MGNAFDAPKSGQSDPSVTYSATGHSVTDNDTAQQTLEAGLKALKQKSYNQAIAHFESVCHHASQSSLRVKAQVGLVKTYETMGNVERAIALCRPLTASKRSSVQAWATQTLSRLIDQTIISPDSEAIQPQAVSDFTDEETGMMLLPTPSGSSHPNVAASKGFNMSGAERPTERALIDESQWDTVEFAVASPSNLPENLPENLPDTSGFKPDESETSQSTSSPDTDLTGFTPLVASPPQPSAQSADATGFTPFDPNDSAVLPSQELRDDTPTQPLKSSDEPTAPLDGLNLLGYGAGAGGMREQNEGDRLMPGAENPHPDADTVNHPELDSSSTASATIDPATEMSGDSQLSSPASMSGSLFNSQAIVPVQPSRLMPTAMPIAWRYAGRAQRWDPRPVSQTVGMGLSQLGTAIALLWVSTGVLQGTVILVSWLLKPFTWFLDLPHWSLWVNHPMRVVFVGLVVLFAVSPWLLDSILQRGYGMKALSGGRLAEQSPEAVRLLKRVCGQRQMPPPQLQLLPTEAPVAFSYGHLPRTTRIVVSQGLLKQLNEDEIAAIYAHELGHCLNWDMPLMSVVAVVMQLPYWVYRGLANEGDRQTNRLVRGVIAAFAAFAYGAFWLCRGSGLWLSKARIRPSDQTATNITGNPNGLARSLLKLSVGMAAEIQRVNHTSDLLERFELLLPIGYRTALSLGSVLPYATLPADAATPSTTASGASLEAIATLFTWDRQNPHRRWLALNNTHPLMGDRLQHLMNDARHWRLEPELTLPTSKPPPSTTRATQSIGRQGAPYFMVLLGLCLSGLLVISGQIARSLGAYSLSWLWSDRFYVFVGCLALALSFGIFLRINAFFPDIKVANTRTNPSLPELLTDPHRMPIDSQPIQLNGKLLGRRGVGNWLSQDLMLETPTGCIRLHYLSQLGVISNLIMQPRPQELVGRPVTVTGWFRRGATPWIDIDMIRTQRGQPLRAAHPIWSTVIAVAAALWGTYVLYAGGF